SLPRPRTASDAAGPERRPDDIGPPRAETGARLSSGIGPLLFGGGPPRFDRCGLRMASFAAALKIDREDQPANVTRRLFHTMKYMAQAFTLPHCFAMRRPIPTLGPRASRPLFLGRTKGGRDARGPTHVFRCVKLLLNALADEDGEPLASQ